ncbi:MAG: FtsX-like permease family protein [Aquabacterium sp.]
MASASTDAPLRTSGRPPRHSPVWCLLVTFSWQELRHHGLRHSAAILAVLLGVALAFSVHLINESALSEFSAAVRAVSGEADMQLRAAHGTLDEQLYPQVSQDRHVLIASPVVDLRVQAGPQPLRILGLDAFVMGPMTPSLLPKLDEDIARRDRMTLFMPRVVFLNATGQRKLGAKVGDTIEVASGLRPVALKVVGTVAAGGEALAVMDIGSAQEAFGMVGRLSRIDVKLQPGADVEAALASLHLPPAVLSDTAEASTQRVSNVSRAYRVNLTVLALIALFTGAFLVFSILSLSVAKRQQQFALLGVLGLSARERLKLVLMESAVIGVVGSVLGIALGTGLAAAALRVLAGDLGGGYFPGIAPRLHWSTGAALVYGALGVAAAIWGGLMPARSAQRMAPAQALKGLGHSEPASGEWWVGPALLMLGVGLAQLPAIDGVPLWAYLSVACLLTGGIECGPVAVALLLGLVMRVVPAPVLARRPALLLALERARHMRRIATITIAGVVASLSLAVALTVMVSSFRGSVSSWLDVVLPADLYVSPARVAQGSQARHLDQALLDAVAQVPGVTRAIGIRVSEVTLRPDLSPVALIARPIAMAARPSANAGQGIAGEDSGPQDLSVRMPLLAPALPPRAGHAGVFVSEAVRTLYGAPPGAVLALPIVPGQPPVPAYVRGVWRDYAHQQGAIIIEQADYQRLTGDRTLDDLALWLAPQARTPDVQAGVRRAAGQQGVDGAALSFHEPREIRQTTMQIFDRSFAVTYWLQAVAIGIGLFGIAASFSAQVLARRKEFGLLSHLGFTRRQVLAILAGEGAALSTVGAVLGLAMGLAVSVVLVHVVNPQSFHWTMDMLLPWPKLLMMCAGVIAAGTLTAWMAGRAAVSRDAVMAVKEDW